ncbi:hypothetical protein ROZALSC1DRAFT_28839 [Rozella allomycis CSF55]|uniref:RNI-like protein n=1 Tax=Rozella allomycis (strain CSF55) TaxID=988480 RepID=A0A4V1IZX5_ROZAC|nr:hypothetical protein ROZALSC1DRAFT_28839 [Rozella allomycis CSF55]
MTVHDDNILKVLENHHNLVGISKLFFDIRTKQLTQSMLDSIADVLQASKSIKHLVIDNLNIARDINNLNFCKLFDSFKYLESLKMIEFELRPLQLEYLSNNILSLGNLKTLAIYLSNKHGKYGYWVNGRDVMQILADNLMNIEELHIDFRDYAENVDTIYFFDKISRSKMKSLTIHGFYKLSDAQVHKFATSYGNL